VIARTGWWRENRLWLPVVPVALAAVALASSYNLSFWRDAQLHDEIATGTQGQYLSVTEDYEDALGDTSRAFRVKLVGLDTTDDYGYPLDDAGPPPDGVDAVVVRLRWTADPDQVLRGCRVSLVDDEGRRYDLDGSALEDDCVPDDFGGPEDPSVTNDNRRGVVPDGEERPPAWRTTPVILVPEGRTITQVLVWWERPRYVRLNVS
jgi:hypothetical protein